MAKSKSGGTRSYIHGRVGADVYSIGKDAKGSKQQVVRSLAESVANPQTSEQMVQRMIMATASEFCKAMRPIIDHSFDGVPTGQPSISMFMSRNIPLMKKYWNGEAGEYEEFNFLKYGFHSPLTGAFVIANGRKKLPDGFNMTEGVSDMQADMTVRIKHGSGDVTMADLRQAWPVGQDGYITIAGVAAMETDKGQFFYNRVRLREDVADTFRICTIPDSGSELSNKCSLEDIFTFERNCEVYDYLYCEYNDNAGYLSIGYYPQGITSPTIEGGAFGVIGSWKTKNGYEHNYCRILQSIADSGNYRSKATAFETWPKGSERFLNGGDL